jgi:hypothetical protein
MASNDKNPGAEATLATRVDAALARRGDATVARWKRFGLWQTASGHELAQRSDTKRKPLGARLLAQRVHHVVERHGQRDGRDQLVLDEPAKEHRRDAQLLRGRVGTGFSVGV